VTGLPFSNESTHDANIATVTTLLENRLADQIEHHFYVPYPTDACTTGHPEVHIINDNWERDDRSSFPVYCLNGMSAERIWADFLEIEQQINRCWLRSLQITERDVRNEMRHTDYNSRVYVERDVASKVSP
jgi:hypothetical protein